jgi:predicted O-methyltransferase YrrM
MTTKSYELQRALGYLHIPELDLLIHTVKSLPANPIVANLGAGGGTSGTAIAESRNDVTLITVDKTFDASPLGCIVAEINALKEIGLHDKMVKENRYFTIHGNSPDVGLYWEQHANQFGIHPELDMVFIDGDHSYEGCKADIEMWTPHIRHEGIVAIHDYDPVMWQSVVKATDDMMKDHVQIALVDSLIVFELR